MKKYGLCMLQAVFLWYNDFIFLMKEIYHV